MACLPSACCSWADPFRNA